MKNLKEPYGRLSRWALLLQEFDYNVVYGRGKLHQDADLLFCRSLYEIADKNEPDCEIPVYAASVESNLAQLIREQWMTSLIV